MRVAFRADGASHMGGGHITRCLALANALGANGAKCRFLSRHLTDTLAQRIRDAGHDLAMLPTRPIEVESGPLAPPHADWLGTTWRDDATDTAAALKETCDWLIVDHYAIDARWHTALRARARNILVIDDLADRPLSCDALLDPNYRPRGDNPFATKLPAGCLHLSGPRMALLDLAFARAHLRAQVRSTARRAFVYLGTTPAGLHIPVLDALCETDLTADLVCASAVAADPRVSAHPAILSGRVSLHGPQPTLLPFMEKADLAVGPIGTSTWERCTVGLPTIAVTIAANQERIAANLAEDGLVILIGPLEKVRDQDYLLALQKLTQPDCLSLMSQRSLALCDGRGVQVLTDVLVGNSRGV
ncbi:UDP-2,4-diacetamido-2,4,6-trideoxy-beta-L-altropyranose hydrolase [Roseicyclus marinus]|uniref:UDP-2,4-diacetamido-2,4,6-trideoxy-beta-L-altropyranose hydrolase n=1 Tax=Roseicyclus marinus TaxID=2161673 RepID=A0AA48KJ32_9RHOB|nr:UDP-2,4-diacetamido-2,4,6-trideoxy-beta-L-altropyranose hydrolase [Roseicyclus marinus]